MGRDRQEAIKVVAARDRRRLTAAISVGIRFWRVLCEAVGRHETAFIGPVPAVLRMLVIGGPGVRGGDGVPSASWPARAGYLVTDRWRISQQRNEGDWFGCD
jgi:hypothetical protein